MKLYLVLFIPLLTVSCAPSYEAAKNQLVAAKSCCRDFSEFDYETLPQDEPFKFDLDQSSPAYNFSSGKSFFKAFQLPYHELPYSINIRSYSQGTTIEDSYIFYPKILLLKDDYTIETEEIPELALSRDDRAAMKENFGGPPLLLSGEILIRSTEQKYVVILTSDELLSSSSRFLLYLGVLSLSPLTPAEGLIDIPHSPIGRIVLEVND